MQVPERVKTDEARTRLLVWTLALLLPLLRVAPILYGYALSEPDRVFLGMGYLPTDLFSYAGLMAQARESAAFPLQNEFTLEPQLGRMVLLFHYAAGRLAAALGVSVTSLWPALQYALGVALVLTWWRLLGVCFPKEPRTRVFAFVLIGCSGGLEWAAWLAAPQLSSANAAAIHQLTPQHFGWSSFQVLYNPLWCAARLLFYGALISTVKAVEEGSNLRTATAALCVALLYAVHPYTAIALGAILGLGFVQLVLREGRKPERRAGLLRLALIGASFAVPLALSRWQQQDPVFAATSAQALWSGIAIHFPYWFLPFGLLLPLAAFGLGPLWRSPAFASRLVVSWIVALVVLTHLPVLSPYRHLALLHVPLCIAAARGAFWLLDRLRAKGLEGARLSPFWRAAAVVVLLGLFATNAPLFVTSLREVRSDERFYLPGAELEALAALREQPAAPVLASYERGGLIPLLARKPVYLGHWFLTLEPDQKDRRVRRFFAPTTDDTWRQRFLAQNGIQYVYVGAPERALGGLGPRPWLEPVFAGPKVAVYRVRSAAR